MLTIDPILKLVASASLGEKKYVLLAGAGVSKDAGAPTAWDLMLKTARLLYTVDTPTPDPNVDLERWFLNSKYAKMGYAQLMDVLYPHYPDQQNFLKRYLNGGQVGESHRGIAELARRGIIRAIITTNFDHFLEKALGEKGLEVQVISTDEDLKNSEPLIHCKAIRVYKPHGDLGRGALRNTPEELRRLSAVMEEELTKVLSEHGVIVLGYSGDDEGIQQVFAKRDPKRYPLFWVKRSPPKGPIKGILDRQPYTFISSSASQFTESFLRILDDQEKMIPAEATVSKTFDDKCLEMLKLLVRFAKLNATETVHLVDLNPEEINEVVSYLMALGAVRTSGQQPPFAFFEVSITEDGKSLYEHKRWRIDE